MAVEQQSLAFDPRFLDRHAGSIISDLLVALVELVANAWDAYATTVDIVWPKSDGSQKFSIKDNGRGMTAEQFMRCWGVFDYDRLKAEGKYVEPLVDLPNLARRRVYGRNGRGRHGGFAFPIPIRLRLRRPARKSLISCREVDSARSNGRSPGANKRAGTASKCGPWSLPKSG